MASTPPSTTAASTTPPPVDSAALRSCPRCRHQMSSLKHDKHTICSLCREVNCNLTDHCDDCRDWSSKTMTTYLSYQRTLASKRSKTPQPATVSQSAATGSSVGPSSVSSAAVDDSVRLKEAVMSAIQSLSQTGRLGTNPLPFTAPFPVPDSESHWVSSGGEGSHQPRNAGGTTRTSAMGACVVSSSRENSTPPSVPFYVSLSHRSDQGMSLSLESHDSARLGIQSSQSLSLGSDQLRVFVGGSLGASSALSPTSLLFPVPDSGVSSLSAPPTSFSSFAPSFLSSVPSTSSFSLSSSSQFSLPAASIPLPSFTPSSLSSASFPSSLLSSSLPPSIPSILSSSFHFSSSSSSSAPVSAPVPSSSTSSSSSLSFLPPPPPGFSHLSASSSSSPHPPSSIPSSSSWSSSSVAPSSGSSFSSSFPTLAAYRASVLRLSIDYQSLARWFVHSDGVEFEG